MCLERAIELGALCPRPELGSMVESEESEPVAVRFAWRWTRPTVADVAESVRALLQITGARGYSFRQLAQLGRDGPGEPVHEQSRGRIWIVADQSQALGARWRIAPT